MSKYISNQLLAELSTTELVMLKDGVDVELERLDTLARASLLQVKDDARPLITKRFAVYELGWKLSSIIEARLQEAHDEQVRLRELITESALTPQ